MIVDRIVEMAGEYGILPWAARCGLAHPDARSDCPDYGSVVYRAARRIRWGDQKQPGFL